MNAITELTGAIPSGNHTLYFIPSACSYPLNLGQFNVEAIGIKPQPPVFYSTSYAYSSNTFSIACNSAFDVYADIDPTEKPWGAIRWLEWDFTTQTFSPLLSQIGSPFTTPNLTSNKKYGIYYDLLNGCISDIREINITIVSNPPVLTLPYTQFFKCENSYDLNTQGWGNPGGGDYYLDGNNPSNLLPGSILAVSTLSLGTHQLTYFTNCGFSTSKSIEILDKPIKPDYNISFSGCDFTINAVNPIAHTGFYYNWYINGSNTPSTNHSATYTYTLTNAPFKFRVTVAYTATCESDYTEILPDDVVKINLPYDEFYSMEGTYRADLLGWASVSGGDWYIDNTSTGKVKNGVEFEPGIYIPGAHDLIYEKCGHQFRKQITIKQSPDAPSMTVGPPITGSSPCNYTRKFSIDQFTINSRGLDIKATILVKWYIEDPFAGQILIGTPQIYDPLGNEIISPEVQGSGAKIYCQLVYNGGCTSNYSTFQLISSNDAQFKITDSKPRLLNPQSSLLSSPVNMNYVCYEGTYIATFTASSLNNSNLNWVWEIWTGTSYSPYTTANSVNSSAITYTLGFLPTTGTASAQFRVTGTSLLNGCVFKSEFRYTIGNPSVITGFHITDYQNHILPSKFYYCNLNSPTAAPLRPLQYGNPLLINGRNWEELFGTTWSTPNLGIINSSATAFTFLPVDYAKYRVKHEVYVNSNFRCSVISDEVEILDGSNIFITCPKGASPVIWETGLGLTASFDGHNVGYLNITPFFTDIKWYLDDIIINNGSSSILATKAGIYKLVATSCGIERTATFTVTPPTTTCFPNAVTITPDFSSPITISPSWLGNYGTDFIVSGVYSIGSVNLNMNRCTKITVKNGGFLTLTNCTLSCCTDWYGIEVENGGKLILNNCVLSDAQVGIYSQGNNAEIQLTNNSFVNNHNHISITNYPLINSSTFKGNYFGPLINRNPDCTPYLNFSVMQGKQVLLNYGADNVTLKGNNFTGNSNPNFAVTGLAIIGTNNTILTLNSSTPNSFKGNLKYGVSIDNNSINYINYIGNYNYLNTRLVGDPPENIFSENVEIGINVVNSPGTQIIANKFMPGSTRAYDGVKLIRSDNCNVIYNKFLNNNRGVQIYNDMMTQAPTDVKLNEFQDNKYGLVISTNEIPSLTSTSNSYSILQNVEFHCNKFFGTPAIPPLVPRIKSNYIGILGSGLVVDQGQHSINPWTDSYNDFALNYNATPLYDRNENYDIVWDYPGVTQPVYNYVPYYDPFPPYPITNLNYIPGGGTTININGTPYTNTNMGMNFYDVYNSGINATSCTTWSLWMKRPTGADLKAIGKVAIYPNPSEGIINISIPEDNELGLLSIYDMTGKVVYSLLNSEKKFNFQIDLSPFSSGLYFLHLNTNNEELIYKLIKK